MEIWVDADGCPVVKETCQIAKENHIPITLCKNNAVNLYAEGAKIISLDVSKDAVDFYIVTHAKKGDIVITQDFGLAAMLLPKGVTCLNQDGRLYQVETMDLLLAQRHDRAKERKNGRYHGKAKKRQASQNDAFCTALQKIIGSRIK